MGKLTATGVKVLLGKPGRHGDGDGLFLQATPAGTGSWVLRVQKDGRRRDIGLGSARKVGLALARTRAAEARSQIEIGVDPVAQRRRAAGIPTFREAAALVHAEHKKTWRNGKHQAQWLKTLETYAYPSIGDRPVSTIEGPAVRDLLADIWNDKPETAKRVLQRVCTVLDWSYSKGFRKTEASRRSITKGLPRQQRTATHFAAMPFADVPAFFVRLKEKASWSRLALEAAILTGARSGEIRGALWTEVDLERGLWTIPASRMKAKREHVVPLSPAALGLFRRAFDLRTAESKLVFQGANPRKPMSDMTLIKLLRDMGETATAHGFRSSFRDWVSEETSFQGELAEAALAHAIRDKTEAAYRRGNLLEKRRKLMDAWAAHCDGDKARVIRLIAAA